LKQTADSLDQDLKNLVNFQNRN